MKQWPRMKKLNRYVNELGSFLSSLKNDFVIDKPVNTKVKLMQQLNSDGNMDLLTTSELGLQHVLCHQFYPLAKRGKLKALSADQLIKKHLIIIDELNKKNNIHRRVDVFDDITEENRKVYK